MAIMGNSRRLGIDAHAPEEPTTAGWPTLCGILMNADLDKLDEVKQDLDRLPTVAGLYSAVLTAFVIESYKALQQDSKDVIIGLLQQLVTQNFASGSGYLNSTSSLPSTPPFEPPLWAVRVNILWFASLILSLASASFGMVVNEWLREFLSAERTEPKERLRVRQYRYPALVQWGVFEIAVFLPLLLQLSLGLFFTGLCFFTAAIHQDVGRATTPLVSAWIFLLFTVTIAPLFAPRCPFKTTFLKRALRVGRRYVAPFFYDLIHLIVWIAQVISTGRQLCTIQVLQRWSLAVGHAMSNLWSCLSAIGHMMHRSIGGHLWEMDWWDLEYTTQKRKVLLEEDEVVKKDEEDVDILLSIDSLMSDDGLLPTMVDALRLQPANIPAFVSHIIGHRVGQELRGHHLTALPDLRPLSKFAWSVLTRAVVNTFVQYASDPSPNSNKLLPVEIDTSTRQWIHDSIIILNSTSKHQLSDYRLPDILLQVARTQSHACSGAVPLYCCLTQGEMAPYDTSNGRKCLFCTLDVFQSLLCEDTDHDHSSLLHLLRAHTAEESFVTSSYGLLQALFRVLTSFLEKAESSQKNLAEIPGLPEALHIVLRHGETFGRRDDAVKLCRQTHFLARFAALLPSGQHRVSEDISEIFQGVHRLTSQDDDSRIQSHLTAACERFCNDGDDDDPLDYVRLCAAFIWWMWDDQTARAVAKAIEKYYRTRGWRRELQRRGYWYGDAPSPTPEELFKEDQDLAYKIFEICGGGIDPELINALWPFVPAHRGDEVLHSIREHRLNYTPPTLPAPSTGLEDSDHGQGGTSAAEGAQEVGDAGQEAPEGQDGGEADAEDAEASGGAYLDAVAVPGGDEGTADQDATGGEAVGEGAAEDGGDLAGGGGAKGMLAMAGNQ